MESLPPLSCPTRALEDPPSQIGGPWFQGIFNCIMEKYERKFLEYHTTSRGCGLYYQIQSIKLFWIFFINFSFNPELFLKTFSPKDTGRLCKFLAELPDGAKLWSLFPSAPGGSSLISVAILRFRHSVYNAQLSPSEDTNLTYWCIFLQILALRINWTCNVVLLQLSTWRSWQIALWAHAPEALELKRMSFRPVCPWIHFVADLVQVN